MKMRVLLSWTLAALAGSCTALYLPLNPAPSLPTNIASSNALFSNTSTLPLQVWPATPYNYPISTVTSLTIERYGRHICFGNPHCAQGIQDNIKDILIKTSQEYEAGAMYAYSWTSGMVNFYIMQKVAIPKPVALQLLIALYVLETKLGSAEVVEGILVIGGEVAAHFALTFPDI